MKIKSKKISALILAGVITIGSFGVTHSIADAQSTSNSITREVTKIQTGTTTANLNMRSSSSTKGKVLLTLKKGTKVEIVKKESNGWYKVKYNTKTGYVSGAYLKVTTTTNSSTGTKSMQTTTGLNVRSGSGTTYKKIGLLKKGEKVTVLSTSNGWAKINYGSGYGYVSMTYLKDVTTNNNTGNNQSGSTQSKKMKATTGLNVRSGAGTNYSKLGLLQKGQEIVVTSISNGWAKFTYNGKTAYVSAQYLTEVSTGNNTNTGNAGSSNETITYREVKYSTLYNTLSQMDGWESFYGNTDRISYTTRTSIIINKVSDKDKVATIGVKQDSGNPEIEALNYKELKKVLNLITNSESTTNAILSDIEKNSTYYTKVYGDLKLKIYYHTSAFTIEFE